MAQEKGPTKMMIASQIKNLDEGSKSRLINIIERNFRSAAENKKIADINIDEIDVRLAKIILQEIHDTSILKFEIQYQTNPGKTLRNKDTLLGNIIKNLKLEIDHSSPRLKQYLTARSIARKNAMKEKGRRGRRKSAVHRLSPGRNRN